MHKDEVIIPIERIINRRNIILHCGKIKKLDINNHVILLDEEAVDFNYLVLALDSKSNFYDVQGLDENSFTLQSYEDANKIYSQIIQLCAKASSEFDPEKRKDKLRFFVGGGGLAGVEFAAELSDYVNESISKYSLNENDLEILVVEAASKILPNTAEYIRSRVLEKLQKKNVKVLTGTRIVKLTEDEVKFSSGRSLKTKTLIWTGGIRITGLIKESGLETGMQGGVIVDEYLRAKGHKNIYVLGDNALAINPTTKNPVPAAAQFALQQGRLAAKNIFNDVYGGEKEIYKPRLWGEFISLGKHLAAGWLSLPTSRRISFAGFLANLLYTAIREKHIFLLRKESRNWITC